MTVGAFIFPFWDDFQRDSTENPLTKNGGLYYYVDDVYVFPVNTQNQALALDQQNLIFELKDIEFALNKSVIQNKYNRELQELIAFLQSNPFLNISIYGFTDNSGMKAKNDILSNDRALAVKSFLVENDIAETRILFAGKGKSNLNRRVVTIEIN